MDFNQKIAAFIKKMNCEYCGEEISENEHSYRIENTPYHIKEAEDNIIITVCCPHAVVNGSHSETVRSSDGCITKDKLLEIKPNEGYIYNFEKHHKATYRIEVYAEKL